MAEVSECGQEFLITKGRFVVQIDHSTVFSKTKDSADYLPANL